MIISAVITQEDGMFVALNPETGVCSQGSAIGAAVTNLKEAVLLYLEEIDPVSIPAFNNVYLTTITL